MTKEDIDTAIKTMEVARESHEDWLALLALNPAQKAESVDVSVYVGDAGFHAACIARYDHVLKVLKSFVA